MLTGFTLPKLLWVRDHESRKLRTDSAGSASQGLHSISAHR
jgi:hypothetical protein